jgi:peptidoglycan/LPS O-acetylase OafA/YrhL
MSALRQTVRRELQKGTVDIQAKRPARTGSELRPHYRADIDGLRAIAILSVVAYHVSEHLLPGGFVGVDMFFVISGFLISSLIFKELDNGGFKFGDFYIRRIRRIFPALLLMMIASLVAGRYILAPSEYAQLSKHVAGGSAFVANLVQWLEAGYFDTDAQLKPLLHLWSLGIEEQFYILWPIAAVLLWRHRFGTAVQFLIFFSFLFSIWRTPHHPVGAFYLPIGRAWELLVGSLLAYQQHEYREADERLHSLKFGISVSAQIYLKDVASLASVALLALSFLIISSRSQFPGWWPLLPCVATALLIWAGEAAWFNAHILSLKPVVFIGLISYPLYLWHWPLLSFIRILSSNEPPFWARLAAAAVALLLAAITYRLVESPLRSSRLSRGAIVAVLCSAMLALGTLGLYTYLRYQKTSPRTSNFLVANCGPFLAADSPLFRYCRIVGKPTQRKTFVVWGDSHANSWLAAMAAVASAKHAKLIEISHPGCPPILGVRRSLSTGQAEACSSFDLAASAVDTIRRLEPAQIFLAARWSLYTKGLRSHGRLVENTYLTSDPHGEATPQTSESALRTGLENTLQQLAKISPVAVIKTVPTLKESIDSGLARNPRGFEPTLAEYRSYEAVPNAIIDEAATHIPRVSAFDPGTILCVQKCRATLNGKLLYEDDSHLSDAGALLFTSALSNLIERSRSTTPP